MLSVVSGNVTSESLTHPANAIFPIAFKDFGNVTASSFSIWQKAASQISVTPPEAPSLNTTDVTLSLFLMSSVVLVIAPDPVITISPLS